MCKCVRPFACTYVVLFSLPPPSSSFSEFSRTRMPCTRLLRPLHAQQNKSFGPTARFFYASLSGELPSPSFILPTLSVLAGRPFMDGTRPISITLVSRRYDTLPRVSSPFILSYAPTLLLWHIIVIARRTTASKSLTNACRTLLPFSLPLRKPSFIKKVLWQFVVFPLSTFIRMLRTRNICHTTRPMLSVTTCTSTSTSVKMNTFSSRI